MKPKFKKTFIFTALIFSLCRPAAFAQDRSNQFAPSTTWFLLQTVPSLTWISFPELTHFAFEWEATPVLYSFGMNKLDPPWHFFYANQPERFAGSLELNISAQLFTSNIKTHHWGFSGQLLVHLPLVQKGEYLGMNAGIARYLMAGASSNYLIFGFSTLFGFVHFNVKYSPSEDIWMDSLEFRFF